MKYIYQKPSKVNLNVLRETIELDEIMVDKAIEYLMWYESNAELYVEMVNTLSAADKERLDIIVGGV